MAYKVANFAGEATVMSAQELCDDAQDKPKVIGRRKRVANANQRLRGNDFSIQESDLVRDGDTLRKARWRWKILMASGMLCRSPLESWGYIQCSAEMDMCLLVWCTEMVHKHVNRLA
jgi:hypothetical protein